MHILLVADGRSPNTCRWIQGLLALQHRVTLVSTYPCAAPEGVEATHIIPVAFAEMAGSQVSNILPASTRKPGATRQIMASARSFLTGIRYLLGPLSVGAFRIPFLTCIEQAKPDLVHALRIPFEGMLAAFTPPEIPLLVSIWGNDLTLHAHRSADMRRFTRRVLQRADGLVADARRDLNLGRLWGFDSRKPTLAVPGGGGIDFMQMSRPHPEKTSQIFDQFPQGVPLVVNPRGFRPGSVRNDIFFQSIPLVMQRQPEARFICTAMSGQPEAYRWINRLKIRPYIFSLPYIPQVQLWELFRRSAITVSISSHDGTPNSLLEAMAFGCFPVAGDIESIREWITPGTNGLLVEPTSPQALAEAILLALEHPELRARAAELNRNLVRQRADVNLVRAQLQVFLERFSK
jgi:glycosyltransferase involved in cell wall biosynthesis